MSNQNVVHRNPASTRLLYFVLLLCCFSASLGLSIPVWPGGVMFTALDLRLKRSRASCLHMCHCHQAVQFGTGQGTVMSCGWEGNRRSGAYHWPCVTDFGGSFTYVLRAKEWEMSTPPTLLVGYGTPSPFFPF